MHHSCPHVRKDPSRALVIVAWDDQYGQEAYLVCEDCCDFIDRVADDLFALA